MAVASNKIIQVQRAVSTEILLQNHAQVSNILSIVLPSPLWSEQVAMTQYLNKHAVGALFNYCPVDGWSYITQGE